MISKLLKDECNNCLTCSDRAYMFELLSEEELKLLNDNKFELTYKKGETIRKQGTYLSHVISINSGAAKLYIESEKGQNIILRIIKPKNFIGGPGMYYDQRHHYSVKALVDTGACFIEKNVFKQVINSNAEFADEFMKDFSRNLLLTYDRLMSLTQKQIPGRMADALLYLSTEIFESPYISEFITKTELADLTGMSKDSAVKILRQFRDENIISLEANQIKILDREALININKIG